MENVNWRGDQFESWNFGDNKPIDNSQNPLHTFDSIVGVYQVTLIVSDINNCLYRDILIL